MPSKLAVWRAAGSLHGKRLSEIALEHFTLINQVVGMPAESTDAAIILARIDVLRAERDEILELYEEGDIDAE